jgi:hypothetical protein
MDITKPTPLVLINKQIALNTLTLTLRKVLLAGDVNQSFNFQMTAFLIRLQ